MPRILIPELRAAPARPAGGTVRALEGATMGTRWLVRWAGDPGPEDLRPGIQARLDTVVAQMSGWEAESDLSRFNRAPAGTWQDLPADVLAVMDCALAVAAETGGAFDPTLGRLVDLWGFGPRPTPVEGPPGEALLAPARAGAGWQRLRLDVPNRRLLQPGGLALDLSGIAKGHAVDLVAEHLAAASIPAFLVEIGGELRGQGVKPDGTPWWVALETPPGEAPAGEQFVVALHGLSVATSGDYRRSFRHGGRRYGHTLDPRTGWPLAESLASVTVLHPSCMRADALATALGVLGVEAGLDHAGRYDIAALFLTREDGRLREHMSPAFAAMLD
ncbi:FAD:protein FMN transferase [Roseicella aquatilis]|uniref:FAD:protein FMN transferase n=1 Tax=Roseicella aquatilis TaxID=2527868 RepID=A0A4R4DJL1_9PROT|nr:FAD:protein FMN transferase [Roseicella aquatilis]TCZ60839.1 FAD:protein FMN transferase [Roseicella aquatilis]